MKKGLVIGISAAAVLIIVVLAVYFIFLKTDTPMATLYIVSGDVQVNKGSGWTSANDGMLLKQDYSIRTLEGSARIVMLDAVIATLKPNSEVSLKEISIDKIEVAQASGKVWNKFMKVSGVKEYSVETPTTVATVRGTAFKSEVGIGSDTILVSEDNVDVQSGNTKKNVKQFGKVISSNGELLDADLGPEDIQELYDSASKDLEAMKDLRVKMLQRNRAVYEQMKKQYEMDDAGVMEFLEKIDNGWIDDREMAAQSPVKLPVLEKLINIDDEIKQQIALLEQIQSAYGVQ